MNIIRKFPRCPPGHFYAAQPPQGKQSDRGWCFNCLPGTFSNESNRDTQCKKCTVCSHELGLAEMQPCMPTADTLCRCRDHYVSEHETCQPFEPIAGSILDPAATESAKSIHSKTIERAFHVTGIRWPFETDNVRNVVTTTVFDGEAYLGSTPVPKVVLAMGVVSFVSIVVLAAVAVTLCVKRWQRNNGEKRQSVEVSADSECHIYEDPETLITEVLPPLRVCLTAAASEASGCASQNLDHRSSPNSSDTSFAPLLDNQTSDGYEPPACCDIEPAHASIFEENNNSASLTSLLVTGITSNAAHVLRKNFFASEICGSADGIAAPSTAATNSGLPGAASERCVDLSASSEIRAVGSGSDRSDGASKTKAGAIAALGL